MPIEDPTSPSQRINADGSFGVTLDESTAPVMTQLRDHVRKTLREATNPTEQAQAIADSFEAVFVALQWLEYTRSDTVFGPSVNDQ